MGDGLGTIEENNKPGWIRRNLRHGVLALLLVLGASQVIIFMAEAARDSLQMDFSAYYTAGEALSAGLSPYVTHVSTDPVIWDGQARYRHSRFLYPPMVAEFFRLWTWIPYHQAKVIWMALSVLCVLATVFLTAVRFRIGEGEKWLVIGLTVVFFPLRLHLERGQIDAYILLVLTLAFFLSSGPGRIGRVMSGVLLAFACLLKLHCLYLLPFFLIRRLWLPLWGFALGLAIISAASIAIPNGLWLARDYATIQVPRIAEHGEFGPTEWRLPADQVATLHKGLPSGFTRKANSVYQASLFEFSANATLVRYIRAVSANLGVAVPLGLISLFVFSVLLLITSRLGAPWVDLVKAGNEDTEWIFWQALLVITLLASPHTWAMNTVWLIPLCVVFFLPTVRFDSPRGSLILGLCGLGFVMLALPDAYWLEFSHPVIELISDGKYVLGELAILAGLILLLRAIGKAFSESKRAVEAIP